MKTKSWAIGLIVLMTALTSIAQLFFKLGADNLVLNELVSYLPLLFGFIIYGIGAVLLILALKHGEVTVLYPVIATSYIWVALISWRVLGEHIGFLKLLGIVSIIVGIVLISFGSKSSGVIGYEEGV